MIVNSLAFKSFETFIMAFFFIFFLRVSVYCDICLMRLMKIENEKEKQTFTLLLY